MNGKQITSFTNEEEEQAGLTKAIPWLVESRLGERGAKFSKTSAWGEKVVVDNTDGKLLISGQNPASAAALAKEVLKALKA